MRTYLLYFTVVMVSGVAQAAAPVQPPLAARGPHQLGVQTLELTKDKYLLTLEGAEHNPYAECPESVRGVENCFDPVWSQPQAHALIEHFATAFFGRFLQGNKADERYLEPNMPGVNLDTIPKVTLQVGRR